MSPLNKPRKSGHTAPDLAFQKIKPKSSRNYQSIKLFSINKKKRKKRKKLDGKRSSKEINYRRVKAAKRLI